ncbi:MAG: hypothetical protein E5X53_30830 [Mesorhizobium sp.]|uniref:hypothetical protein n=1 Tax=Mesorhizobium sp. TaxID=1871066 RepID=UPI00120B5A7D|nr:hypothetical protein [Mesorhizobium sp.]TIP69775.1 MAG: hypothetical protein E5X55_30595 [Mesorhizobium sp.]TIQ04350.1 MAG: hypothetical protein E5X57_29510 [Mesorhizobium sp.]TIR48154.1 MAG: hypothetical protein E5X53_30830 [Mesorhizobium sp.]TJV94558.1 MAG: hypothetical protein E5X52_28500 [Mesorhizobium sp.]
MRDYSKISPKIWRSTRFHDRSDDAKFLHLYLLSSTHQTSAGCFTLPDAYAIADLNWTMERFKAAHTELVAADMIVHDDATNEYFIPLWFRHNPPMGPKHQIGVKRLISQLESDHVREAAEADLHDSPPVVWLKPDEDPLGPATTPHVGNGRRRSN